MENQHPHRGRRKHSVSPNGKKHHRGRRKKKTLGYYIANLVLVIAIVVFCISAYKLFNIGSGYVEGRSEYEEIIDLAIANPDAEGEEPFRVNFDELLKINEDTIGWIRFYPEPEIINYPVVQGEDNDYYLKKTFSSNENTLGSIFVDKSNSADFSDKHTLIYGHRMKDGSMFRKLEEYEEKSFWEKNPYFYIYTPDGRELKYQIYSSGVVDASSEVYNISLDKEENFEDFINVSKKIADYDTGVEVTTEDKVITLSTCTSAGDDYRFIVNGVLVDENRLEE